MLEFKQITTKNIFEDYHKRELEEIQTKIINEVVKQQQKFIEDILRNHVSPPIKGEITKGKIRWRGLEFMNDVNYSRLWVRQRGVDIPIYLDYKFMMPRF